jgi:di- and tripeptidase
VPDQDLDSIAKSLCTHLETSFKDLKSPNALKVGSFFLWFAVLLTSRQVTVDNTANWWLGELDDFWFKALESAVQEEWGMEPLRIREGGVSHVL